MKTNKLWSIIMMLALVFGTTFTFSSCSDDDDDVKTSDAKTLYNELIGTWYKLFDEDERTENEWGYETTYNADGTVITKWYTHSGVVIETSRGDRSLLDCNFWTDGDFVYIANPEDGKVIGKYYISGDKLHMFSWDEESNEEEEIVETRGNIPASAFSINTMSNPLTNK